MTGSKPKLKWPLGWIIAELVLLSNVIFFILYGVGVIK